MSGTTECHPMPAAFISTLVAQEKRLGANTATVDTPYDDANGYAQCQPTDPRAYEALWVDAIHAVGMHVWFRQAWNSWTAYYGEPKLTYATSPAVRYETAGGASAVLNGSDTTSYLAKTYHFILDHREYFSAGDIFTPASEADGAGIGPDPGCFTARCQFPSVAQFNRFLRDSITLDRAAFAALGIDVFVGLFGTSCEYLDRLEPSTVAVMGVVSTDCYAQTITRLQRDLDVMHQTYGAPLVLSEWGDIWDGASQPETNTAISGTLQLILRAPYISGMGYWQGVGGPGGEGLMTYPALEVTPAGYEVQRWYSVGAGSCQQPADPLTTWEVGTERRAGDVGPTWCRIGR